MLEIMRYGDVHYLLLFRDQVYIVEAVRNMFHEYAKRQCHAIDELQDALVELTGSEYDEFEDFDD